MKPGNVFKPLFLALCAAALPRPAAAALSGGAFSVPVMFTVSGGAASSGGSFALSAVNLGGPLAPAGDLTGGSFSLAPGGAEAMVIVDTANGDLSGAYCYPVPYKPSAGHGSVVTFTGLTSRASVRIYTISGELVRALEKNGLGEKLDWDVKNSRGQRVASGVYLYTIKSGGETVTGKLMVIW